ncbi:hypothetical protein [Candidatus Viridilinea mediisalina]|uniref:Uncharacterized protein n=1 Tax=Candidatus Viridilinea mediisalina TaxID=2024553 RepID=A0A2A6REF4_9CHLR|nr:hypothetical protein [Candidatus Viridilinea mediisalina]PDW00926.1 hypothetical protein CJ255_20060 [Candidatus Viridilinea mediisalina]
MTTTPPILIAADIGNVNTKFRRAGGAWVSEPSLVWLSAGRQGFSFRADDAPLRPVIYRSGPAELERNVPYLVGHDAQRAGMADMAIIGSAEHQVLCRFQMYSLSWRESEILPYEVLRCNVP